MDALQVEVEYKPFEVEYGIEDWAACRRMLLENDYRQGRGNAIDRGVAHSGICPTHDAPSRYEAYYLGSEYRAFAICDRCNKAAEF